MSSVVFSSVLCSLFSVLCSVLYSGLSSLSSPTRSRSLVAKTQEEIRASREIAEKRKSELRDEFRSGLKESVEKYGELLRSSLAEMDKLRPAPTQLPAQPSSPPRPPSPKEEKEDGDKDKDEFDAETLRESGFHAQALELAYAKLMKEVNETDTKELNLETLKRSGFDTVALEQAYKEIVREVKEQRQGEMREIVHDLDAEALDRSGFNASALEAAYKAIVRKMREEDGEGEGEEEETAAGKVAEVADKTEDVVEPFEDVVEEDETNVEEFEMADKEGAAATTVTTTTTPVRAYDVDRLNESGFSIESLEETFVASVAQERENEQEKEGSGDKDQDNDDSPWRVAVAAAAKGSAAGPGADGEEEPLATEEAEPETHETKLERILSDPNAPKVAKDAASEELLITSVDFDNEWLPSPLRKSLQAKEKGLAEAVEGEGKVDNEGEEVQEVEEEEEEELEKEEGEEQNEASDAVAATQEEAQGEKDDEVLGFGDTMPRRDERRMSVFI